MATALSEVYDPHFNKAGISIAAGYRPSANEEFMSAEQLAELGLVSFPLLSGGKGVHVVVPLTPDAEWPAVRAGLRARLDALQARRGRT